MAELKPSMDEIRIEWKAIRSELGNLICHIDNKICQLGDVDNAYQKGYEKGVADSERPLVTNAQKFEEVFGFLPKPLNVPLSPIWWNVEYKAPEVRDG